MHNESKLKKRIIAEVTEYENLKECKDLIYFCVCSEYFVNSDDEDELDFDEVIIVVERDWLFNMLKCNGITDPIKFLQEEYTSDDSIEWYNQANSSHKIVAVSFR